MLLFLIWFLKIIHVNNFVLQNSYNIRLKDSAHYKIDIPVNDDDYQLIGAGEMKEYKNLDIKGNVLYNLNKLASKQYGEKVILKDPAVEPFERKLTTKLQLRRTKAIETWIALTTITRNSVEKIIIAKEDESYNYNNLANEYLAEEIEEAKSDLSYRVYKSVSSETGLANFVKRILSLKLYDKCRKNQMINFVSKDKKTQRQSLKEFELNLQNVIRIWLIVYFAIALPLWCTRGWCCCCLFCKFFKPQQTIEEAKKYLASNPPGIFLSNKKELFTYDPTDRERSSYEEFEHFMRTL